jgi:hypothetical protein
MLIRFTQEALEGQHNASFYAPKERSPEPVGHALVKTPQLPASFDLNQASLWGLKSVDAGLSGAGVFVRDRRSELPRSV